jgi:predicted phage terminase large subunit-like protein
MVDLAALESALLKETQKLELLEEADRLSDSLVDFIRAAWPVLKPQEPYQHNWHIDAICEKLEAVSRGEIHRLQVWIPPGMMKSMTVSVFWHPWEWTKNPWLRYWGASYETRLASRLSAMSRDLMLSDWYRARWGHMFEMIRDAEHYYGNDKGGTRLATAPGSTGSGEHGHRILIDDPINARQADATSRVVLEGTNEWYNGTVSSRGIASGHARIIIMQRLHENDLAAHVYDQEHWEILCLPERYEADHPFVWPDDPRKEGELLWPEYRTESMSQALAKGLGTHRAAGQLQQRPAAREGEILKRNWWRFYDPKIMKDPKRIPKFRTVVQSIDTPLKDKESNDLVAIQAWGVLGADRYLIDLKKGHMNYSQARRQILEQARYVRQTFPKSAHHVLIENAGYGVELITDLKRERGLTGVVKISTGGEGDKILRAEAASSDLESGNCYLPGRRLGSDELSMPDEANCPADVVDFINSCAIFPNGLHDDDVDAWSQCMNWLRSRTTAKVRMSSPFRRRS